MKKKMESISKEELESLLIQWGKGIITSDYLHKWMDSNYFPLHQKIGAGEPAYTQKAMNVIMNEIELTTPSAMFPGEYQHAINYLKTNSSQYDKNKSLFLKNCFSE